MRSVRIAALAILGLAAWCAAAAAAPAITDYITVQPIDVCATDGTDCAQPPVDLSTDEMAAQEIYAQAGLGVIFLPEHTLDDSSYLTTSVDSSGNPIDQAHQLLRLPNSAASPNPTTLNAYFIDTLTQTNGSPIFGIGLIGSNGSIISEGGAIDTLAHEIGHNLGLLHVDGTPQDDPDNLMRSVGRNVPATLADITPDGASDVLNASQIAQVKQPLFTVDNLDVTVGRASGCFDLISGCLFNVAATDPSGSTTEQLQELRLRFLSASDLAGFVSTARSINCSVDATSTMLAGGGVELDYVFPTGCMADNDSVHFDLDYPIDPNSNCGLCGDPTIYTPPFSAEFDFTDGETSTALYDATGDSITSSDPTAQLGFIGTPTYGDGVTVPYDPLAFDTEDNPAPPVPEPNTALLLAVALPLLLLVRRAAGRAVA